MTATDEVWRIQNANEPECRFFRRSVLGDESPTTGTLQGTYVFAPSGKLLARRNSNNPELIVEILETAWASWLELPAAERHLADKELVAAGFRWEDLYPEDGLVLRRTARDLPEDSSPYGKPSDRFNRDAVWFSAAEARSMLPATLRIGARHRFSKLLTDRLSCLVFVDNARGQTIPYHPSEDTGSELWAEVTGLEGDRVTLEIVGHTAVDAKGPWLFGGASDWEPRANQQWAHSISTRVLGSAVFDVATDRFVAFELLALGKRRGRTINHGRGPGAVGGIGFVCEIAPKSWRLPPTFIDVYGVDWAAPPR